ncbi:hypothetical protein [Sphingobium fuliginis]|uniref:Glycine zipper family protein n=1 Tax=Sphingobium fuliginis ATCC 27551 TaxID=1208342 RepID=A0A5B8CGT8_SPHSA|nr:hypothetical protein [Sphingobium fuliginis]QDC38145.1 hypothetical protein FIL70_13830 [Sphingobium fuliginis ATCC 27551]
MKAGFVGLGLALGAGIGVATGNVAVGVALGLVCGVVISAAKIRRSMSPQNPDPDVSGRL